ncbi:MAG TPA: hypothetical protein VHN59_06075 [Chitinophagaceae bacterium]|nr:hypothetical protein [Chitinophagaceae bacterium]
MSKHIQKLNKFLNELKGQESKYTVDVAERLAKIYGSGRRKRRPDTFKDSSFLYIRSYDGDNGIRPFSNIPHWNSPDIAISPVSQLGDFTTTLEAGKSYDISTRLHNRGDLIVPYPKVEFFLTDPTLGFNTTVAKYLGVSQLPSLLLPANNGEAHFLYNVPATEAGHKCLFARTFSFSPLDKPFDLHALDPRLDRHVAQKNLNFVAQNTAYAFNLIHQPNADETIAFKPLTRDQVHALQHPNMRSLKIGNMRNAELLGSIKIELTGKTKGKLAQSRDKTAWSFKAANERGPNLDRQSNILKQTEAIIQNVYSGKSNFADHKKDLQAFRDMNKSVEKTTMQITVPDFGLPKGAAVGFDIVNVNLINGQLKGGITIIAMG